MHFSVGANVIIVREGKLLLGLRKETFGEGTWGLPGGHVEPNETFENAARRELQEETGLLVSKLTFSSLVDQLDSDAHYLQVTFIGENSAGEAEALEPEECYEWAWFPLHSLPEPLFFPHITPIRLYIEKAGPFAADDRLTP